MHSTTVEFLDIFRRVDERAEKGSGLHEGNRRHRSTKTAGSGGQTATTARNPRGGVQGLNT